MPHLNSACVFSLLKFLEPQEVAGSGMVVCKEWLEAGSRDSVWKPLHLWTFPNQEPSYKMPTESSFGGTAWLPHFR